MTDDDFDKLQQRYHDATIDERNRLWPDFIRAIRERHPGFQEEFDRAFRSGDYLMAMAEQCMKRVFARPDLDAGRQINAQEDAAVLFAVSDKLKQADFWPRGLGVELATRALLIGLRAGVSPLEVEELRRRAVRMSALNAANEPKKEKPAVAHAKELAIEIAGVDPDLNSVEIAEEIPKRWRLEDAASPKPTWLVALVRKWRRDNVIPPPTRPRRRTYPLRRFRR